MQRNGKVDSVDFTQLLAGRIAFVTSLIDQVMHHYNDTV